jgi:hypothetical protein
MPSSSKQRGHQVPSTSGGLSIPMLSLGGGGDRESTQIGLAALQHKAMKQQEQLEKTSFLGFRFPLQMSPLLPPKNKVPFQRPKRQVRERVGVVEYKTLLENSSRKNSK